MLFPKSMTIALFLYAENTWILIGYLPLACMHAQYGRLEWFGHVILHIRMAKILMHL